MCLHIGYRTNRSSCRSSMFWPEEEDDAGRPVYTYTKKIWTLSRTSSIWGFLLSLFRNTVSVTLPRRSRPSVSGGHLRKSQQAGVTELQSPGSSVYSASSLAPCTWLCAAGNLLMMANSSHYSGRRRPPNRAHERPELRDPLCRPSA